MIAAWMLYAAVLGLLLLCAALPVERYMQMKGYASRRVWLVGLAGSLLLPALGVVLKDAPPAFEVGDRVIAATPSSGAVMSGVQLLAPYDVILAWSWLAASTLLLGYFVIGFASTVTRMRRWEPTRVDGVDVLLSPDTGPAVIGFLRGRIVLPTWVLALDATARTMMLRHEDEHRRAGDPATIALGCAFAVLMPWNPAVWIMVRRLRLAIEVDCDRRVVAPGDLDLRGYAELLLAVGARRSVPAWGMGFSVGRPFLEERIDRMTHPPVRMHRTHAGLLVAGVVSILALAWSVPQPVRAMWVSESYEYCPEDTSKVSRTMLESVGHWSS